MNCKICGHRSNTIGAMALHYRKKHPSAMKRTKLSRNSRLSDKQIGSKYCPNCGKKV